MEGRRIPLQVPSNCTLTVTYSVRRDGLHAVHAKFSDGSDTAPAAPKAPKVIRSRSRKSPLLRMEGGNLVW